jgi:predicted neuraminidase
LVSAVWSFEVRVTTAHRPFWLFVLMVGTTGAMAIAGDAGSQQAVVEAELIFPPDAAATPACHASTIVQTPDGTLLAAWFGGAEEGANDVGIWLARREDAAWSKPVEVANGVMSPQKRCPCWNPVLFQPRIGPLVLFFKVGPAPDAWWGEMMSSSDSGRTWQGRRRLPPNVLGPSKDKPVELPDGRILCPSSTEHAGWRIHLEVTRDLKTWGVIGPLNDPCQVGAIQPTILQYAGGRLQMLCRTQGTGLIAQCWSPDAGRTWGELTLTGLPNPNAGIDAVTLRDGRQLLVFNNTPHGRTPLNVAVSSDGKQWNVVLTLEDEPGEYSYPAVIQTTDGRVHLTYTYLRKSIKHVALDPTRL